MLQCLIQKTYQINLIKLIWHYIIKYKSETKRCYNCSRAVYMKRFYFALLKTDHFWNFNAFLKKQKLKVKFSDNLGQNIWKLSHVLAQFLFIISETELDYYQQKLSVRVNSRVDERLKGMLWPIFCIDKNTHSDRKFKIM